jgi:hypothetical protein
VDPRTGEILNADILIAAGWIQAWQGEYRQIAGPDAMIGALFREDSLLRADPNGRGRRLCTYAEGLARQATLLRASLAAAGVIKPGTPVPREYIGEALKELVMHEVGHTLGLRHNFRGTATIPSRKLGDRAFTAVYGTSGSVMDYNPPAIALDRSKQGDYYSKTIGTYDRWAIRYGYADVASAGASNGHATAPAVSADEERAALGRLAAEAANPEYLYGSDEDAGFAGFGLDPSITRWDQTADPLAWATNHVVLVNRLFDSLETRLMAPGDGYPKLRQAFTDLMFERFFAALVTTKYIGGAATSRDHHGDPSGRPAFVDVPAQRQREALQFLAREGLGEHVYRFSPALLNSLAPSRWWHWGQHPFGESRIDYPLHQWALSFQSTLVQLVTEPMVLERIRDAELRAAPGQSVVTLPELLSTLTAAIWAEAGYGGTARNAGSIRRDVQRWYLTRLTRMIVAPRLGTPEDARAVARTALQDLGNRLDRALTGSRLDAYTRAHYADSRQRLRQALNAQVVQPAEVAR